MQNTGAISRRRAAALLPALLTAAAPAKAADLPSKTVNADEAQLRQKEGVTTGRLFFEGMTHENIRVELHETILQPGKAPHAPHRHAREEMVIVKQGKLLVEIEGEEPKVVAAGGAVYVASNKMHGWKNAGDSITSYFVVEIGNNS
ncbi:MAG: cupin domain-containing protein [Bryobacterales bacterium]|nr:cupin domain-containing protein [Bryobacterales bacterium]